jgi:hypothetical protein
MKLVSGALLLVASEQAFAHSKMVVYPHQEAAAEVLLPASVVFLTLGSLLLIWGLLTESRGSKSTS